jgi:malonyl-CoA O-methyltransferase
VDGAALDRAAARLAVAVEAPWVHGEVARRMAERLAVVKLSPAVVLDWWSATGASRGALKRAYPKARVVRVEHRAALARPPAPGWLRVLRREPVAVEGSAVQAQAAQLVWANMALHHTADPLSWFRQWHHALAVDGFLMFSTLGPGTLESLRELYREAGWGPPHAPFVDMHDLGDMLVAAGFADPVMDQEVLRLTWGSPAALLAELRALGANADPSRHAGLRTPRWHARLAAALADRAGADGRIALEFEVVYGHAFKPPPRVAMASETRLAPEALRQMARRPRGQH